MTLLAHTSLDYEEILRRTLPQLEALLARLGRHVQLKIGLPGGFGALAAGNSGPVPEPGTDAGRTPKLSELLALAGTFNAGTG